MICLCDFCHFFCEAMKIKQSQITNKHDLEVVSTRDSFAFESLLNPSRQARFNTDTLIFVLFSSLKSISLLSLQYK